VEKGTAEKGRRCMASNERYG